MMIGGHNRLTIEIVKKRTPEILEGYECISKEYTYNTDKLEFKCPRGHIFSTSWSTFFYNKKGCPICRKEFCGIDSKGINRIYKNKDWLHNQYINEVKSTKEIAKFCGVGHRLILSWLYKFNIPVRSSSLSTSIGQCKNIKVRKKLININISNKTKLCSCCGLILNLDNFRKNRTTKDGYQGYCSMCMSQYNYGNSDFSRYRIDVDFITNVNFRKFYYYINPNKYPRNDNYHLDHIYSVHDGFINKVDKHIIASPVNLRIMRSRKNVKKNKKSDISLETLCSMHESFMKGMFYE